MGRNREPNGMTYHLLPAREGQGKMRGFFAALRMTVKKCWPDPTLSPRSGDKDGHPASGINGMGHPRGEKMVGRAVRAGGSDAGRID